MSGERFINVGEDDSTENDATEDDATEEPIELEPDMEMDREIENAKQHFVDIAKTEGPESQVAIEAVGAYHDLLQQAANLKYDGAVDRDIWLSEMMLKAYQEAAQNNPAYNGMVADAQYDLEMISG